MPTWDEVKRKPNIWKHKIDFLGSEELFDGPVAVLEDDRDEEFGELRLNVVGWFKAMLVHIAQYRSACTIRSSLRRRANTN